MADNNEDVIEDKPERVRIETKITVEVKDNPDRVCFVGDGIEESIIASISLSGLERVALGAVLGEGSQILQGLIWKIFQQGWEYGKKQGRMPFLT